MSVLCSAVHIALPTVGTGTISGRLWSHIESCESCQDEYAFYREMYEKLAELRDAHMAVPVGLTKHVMDSLGPVAVPDPDERWDHVVPVAAAAALATAAAGTVALVRFYRHRAA